MKSDSDPDHKDEHGHDHDHPHDHDHDHGHHHHGHGHSHAPASFGRAFAIGVTLNFGFVVLEVVYGLMAHSLALVADAGHNLGDVFGLLLAWGAAIWSRRPATTHFTYGWKRSSVLAALGNAIFLLISVGVIGWEAVRRLSEPSAVEAKIVIWVSAAGIIVNTTTALMFMAGRKGDLNVRAAFMHMMADAVISAGVVVAGVVIVFTGWLWLDPVVSLALVAVIVVGTWGLLRDSFNLVLDAVPAGIDVAGVREYLAHLPAVVEVHHLHIWGLSTSDNALTVHLVLERNAIDHALLETINHDLEEKFGIGHATVQFEAAGQGDCSIKECCGVKAHPHQHGSA